MNSPGSELDSNSLPSNQVEVVADPYEEPITFLQMVEREEEAIQAGIRDQKLRLAKDSETGAPEFKRFAFSLSGGGIRSACINLGVAQGLAKEKLLRKFHYLSTVSGGGYTGGWLSTWIKETTRTTKTAGADLIEKKLADRIFTATGESEAEEISNLRFNSNYLTPEKGGLSVDLLTCVMIVLRNLLVNWLVLASAAAAVLALVILILTSLSSLVEPVTTPMASVAWISGGIGLTGLLVNGCLAVMLMPGYKWAGYPKPVTGMPSTYQCLMYVRWAAVLVSSVSLTIWVREVCGTGLDYRLISVPLIGVVLLPYAFAILRGCFHNQPEPEQMPGEKALANRCMNAFRLLCGGFLSVTVNVLFTAGLVWFLAQLPHLSMPHAAGRLNVVLTTFMHLRYLSVAPFCFTALIVIQNFLLVGCMSQLASDEDREWWSRSNASLILLALGQLCLCVSAIFGPIVILWISHGWHHVFSLIFGQLTLGGIISLLSSSSQTPATEKDKPAPYRMLLLTIGGVIFFILIAFSIATLNYEIFAQLSPYMGKDTPVNILTWALVTGGWLGLAIAANYTVNINQFSLQCLYRNRLLRCFIGAVRRASGQRARDAFEFEPFTGFDTTDNYDVSDLAQQFPVHVINVAQNLIHPSNLAWQERKAESLTISPFHVGSSDCYRPTEKFGDGISIGTAIATSGAAANPSMGYVTSPVLELLMTLFNLRLGWWVGNPTFKSAWKEVGPQNALRPLLQEMFGQTREGQKYILLSDGGHFENLGVYEMIRRRCHFILAVDGGADPNGVFEDLGNAVRKIRIDLGTEIKFLINYTTPDLCEKERKRQHFAVAKISYPPNAGEPQTGWLLYIKGCLNGDESADIYQYKRFNADFPHQSTLNQWFNESEFESYRALGMHSIEWTLKVLKNFAPGNGTQNAGFPNPITSEMLGEHKLDFEDFHKFIKSARFI